MRQECITQIPTTSTPSKYIQNLAKHRGYISSRKVNALCLKKIEEDIKIPCGCGHYCEQKLDVYLVLRWRKKIHLVVQGFSRQLQLFNIIRETKIKKKSAKCNVLHVVEGHEICKNALANILLKISLRSYYRTSNQIRQGIQYLVRDFQKCPRADRGAIAVGFISSYIELMGDTSPETRRILLPVGMSTVELYKRYRLFYGEDERVKEKRFYQLMQKHFPHVTYQHGSGGFTKCSVCVAAKEILEQNHPTEVHEATRRRWDEHLLRQQKERQAYYKRRHEAIDNPKEKLSIILDGMDQSKTNIPHFKGWNSPKVCDKSRLLQTHITGSIVHGISHHAIIDCLQWPHDSNLALSCLLYCLSMEAKENTLPPVLCVQLDNCSRENKNRYFLGMMAYLVYNGFVKEVLISFLMVGHTHEDIDGGFSHISRKLRKHSAKTLPRLIEIIETCISSGMKTSLLPACFDIKKWIGPHLNDIHNQSCPHVYRLYLDKPNHVALKYKYWSTDLEWLPCGDDDPLEVFKLNEEGSQCLPLDDPIQVVPDITSKHDLHNIKSNLINLDSCINESELSWWEDFLECPLSILQCDSLTVPWYLCHVKPVHSQNSENVQMVNITSNNASPLDLFMDKENCTKKVYTGKRRAEPHYNNQPIRKIPKEQGYMVIYKDEDGDIGLGKVTTQIGNYLTVLLFNGSITGKWQQVSHVSPVTIHKEWIIDGMLFQLTVSGFLPSKIKKCLRYYEQNQ